MHSNRTWKWSGDITLKFSSSSQINVEGTLEANDMVLTSSGSYWEGIYFASGSDGDFDDVQVLNVKDEYTTSAGIRIYNASPVFNDIKVEVLSSSAATMYGVYLSGSYETVEINNSDIQSSDDASIRVSGAATYIELDNSNIAHNSSSPAIEANNYGIVNNDYTNVWGGKLKAISNGQINAGTSTAYNNDFCENVSSSLETTSGGAIVAVGAGWYTYPPAQSGSSITVSNGTSENCPTEPTFSTAPEQHDRGKPTTANNNRSQIGQFENSDETLLLQALEMIKEERYESAVGILNGLIEIEGHPYAHIALLTLGRIYAKAKLPGIKTKFEVLSQTEGNMRATAWGLLAGALIVDGDLQQAADSYTALKDAYSGTEEAFYAQISLVDIYIQMKDFGSAEDLLLAAIPTSEDQQKELLAFETILAKEAKLNGYETKTNFESSSRYRSFEEIYLNNPLLPSSGNEVSLNNYPNPFNPTTTFSFTLAGADQVKLAVYDLLGREIEVLVDEYRGAGQHVVNFNASSYSSGSYFYRLTNSQGTYTRMMSVLK